MTPPMFLQHNIMVLDFNPQNISQFQLQIVIFAIWPLHIKEMENSPWLWVKEDFGCNSTKLQKSQHDEPLLIAY